MLMDAKADTESSDNYGLTALIWAARVNHATCGNALEIVISVDFRNDLVRANVHPCQ